MSVHRYGLSPQRDVEDHPYRLGEQKPKRGYMLITKDGWPAGDAIVFPTAMAAWKDAKSTWGSVRGLTLHDFSKGPYSVPEGL